MNVELLKISSSEVTIRDGSGTIKFTTNDKRIFHPGISPFAILFPTECTITHALGVSAFEHNVNGSIIHIKMNNNGVITNVPIISFYREGNYDINTYHYKYLLDFSTDNSTSGVPFRGVSLGTI